MASQIAWIGLGNMGRGMCKNLVEKGALDKPLLIHNRTLKRAEDLHAALGGDDGKTQVASSIEDTTAAADIIFTCLGDDAAIQQTIDAALKHDVTGKLFVECSTVHPDTTTALASRVTSAGAAFVAMPVFGPPPAADAGQLICVLAGAAADVARVRPYTTGVMGKAVIDYGDQAPGQASLLKIVGNSMVLQMVESLAEAHTLAETTGLGVDNLHQFVASMFPGAYAGYSDRMRSGDYWKREEPLFGVDWARKDAGHVLKLAEATGAKSRAVEVADQHLKEVKDHLGAKGDMAAIYGAVRKESGLKFENSPAEE